MCKTHEPAEMAIVRMSSAAMPGLKALFDPNTCIGEVFQRVYAGDTVHVTPVLSSQDV